MNIAASIGVDDPKSISFITDNIKEADAAKAAGWTAILAVRAGNPPLPAEASNQYQVIESLAKIA